MKTKIIALVVVAILSAVGVTQLVNFPKMRYTVHVIGEDGQPISGVKTASLFNKGPVGYGQKMEVPETTDDNGNFTAEGYSDDGVPAGKLLSLDGYYDSGVLVPHFYTSKDGHWQPWDQIYTTVLRKVGTRIPMYAKKTYSEIPVVDQPCGYDLETGDWITPYGKGSVADFIVTLKRQHQNEDNYDDIVTLTFSNPDDGIQETQLPKEFANSVFKWPREAPENGYQSNLTIHVWSDSATGMHGDLGDAFTNKKYFFRVRTLKKDEKIVSALYGKINEGMQLAANSPRTCGISIFYYLNPTPLDRNLEFSGDNLFTKLSQDESTHEP